MNWRTDTPTAKIIVALISDGGGYDVLYRRDDGKYVDRYDELPYSLIEKWADLEEGEPATDCSELEEEIDNYIGNHFSEAYDGVLLSDVSRMELAITDIAPMARHFAQWGAEHFRNATKKLTVNDLELLYTFLYAVKNNKSGAFTFTRLTDEQYQEVLNRFEKHLKKQK